MDIKNLLKSQRDDKKLMAEDDMDKLADFLCKTSDNTNVEDIFYKIDKILPHLKNTNDNSNILSTHLKTKKNSYINNKKFNQNRYNVLTNLNNSIDYLIRTLNKLIITANKTDF
jgi:hypothetical protein